MTDANLVRSDRTNAAADHGNMSTSRAVKMTADRAAYLSEQACRRGALSRRNPRSPAWFRILPSVSAGKAGPSSAPTRVRAAATRVLRLPPIELNSSPDEAEDEAAREEWHMAMAHRNSLTTIVTDIWDKEKRACDADDELARDIRCAKKASIRLEMVRGRYVVVDYSDESSDYSDV
jgi:hypothetical protein